MDREYESRKQINNVYLPDPTIGRRPCTSTSVTKQLHPRSSTNGVPHLTSKPANYVSPPPDLNPKPAKRYKFRNMLTRDGRLVGHEEVRKLVDQSGRPKIELIDFSQTSGREEGGSDGRATEGRRVSGSRRDKMDKEDGSQVLSFESSRRRLVDQPQLIDLSPPRIVEWTVSTSERVSRRSSDTEELLNLSYAPATNGLDELSPPTTVTVNDSRFQELVDLWPFPSPEPPPTDNLCPQFTLWNEISVERVPTPNNLSPEASTVPSSPSIQSASTTPIISTAIRNTAVSPRPSPSVVPAKLLDLDGNTGSVEMDSGALGDLAGLDFESTPPLDDIMLPEHALADPINPSPAMTRTPEEEAEDKNLREEAIVFQGRRHARRSTPAQIKLVDPKSADRAFRMFSQAIKQHK